ncbi:hypothetical protein [Streptomyces sp. G1]|uniref:hypothetical protein n=1 Tax=Streptomyces sp. G1 TaxID=361572 RepID=UPI00202E47B2|nr:hypothetical protein [Streptomyces sp. G1]MCM1964899.1 hypothetical protein [Streptomyces sp. G1]
MNASEEERLEGRQVALTLAWAVSVGTAGDPAAGLRMVQPLFNRGPRAAYRLTIALAGLAITPTKTRHPEADGFFAMAVDVDPETGERTLLAVDELPPVQRAGARIMAAVATGDLRTAEAVFLPVAEAGAQQLGELVAGLYQQAVMAAVDLAEIPSDQWRGRS